MKSKFVPEMFHVSGNLFRACLSLTHSSANCPEQVSAGFTQLRSIFTFVAVLNGARSDVLWPEFPHEIYDLDSLQ